MPFSVFRRRYALNFFERIHKVVLIGKSAPSREIGFEEPYQMLLRYAEAARKIG